MRCTSSHALLAAIASIALLALPVPAFAQRGGGGHAGGGGGFHGGGGGGFRGGGGFSGGGYHGGSIGGGYRGGGFTRGGYPGAGNHGGSFGGYRGGYGAGRGLGSARGSYGGMRSGAMRGSSQPWASEGRGFRNTSPGWHSFQRSSNIGNMASRGGNSAMARGFGNSGMTARAGSGFHKAIADGHWHGFGRTARGSISPHTGSNFASMRSNSLITHGSIASMNAAWRGNGWRGGWGGHGWRGGWGGGWGWGGWGCCGWGLGWGWGWGWGPGWGFAWDPFWAWPPYWYNPYLYDTYPAYIYPDAW